jgi:murein L,D-transpeptidase YafK
MGKKACAMTTKRILLHILLIFMLLAFKNAHRRPVRKNFFNRHLDGEVYILVIKSNYELQVYDKDGWYATYPAVFGSKSLDDKMIMGDRKTPEGTYHITSKRPHEKWDKIMDLDYPTQEDIAKFNERKAQGLIPKTARIGNGIAIHGTWPHDEVAVDAYQNWTNGCIALKREDMDEVYEIAPVGTKVIIQH